MFSTVQARRLSLLLIASAVVGALPETLAPSGSHDAIGAVKFAGRNNPWLAWVVSAQALGTALASFAVGIGRRFEQPSGLMGLTLASGVMLLGGALAFDLNPGILGLANLLFGMTFAFTITARTAFTRTIAPSALGASVASAITLVMAGEALGSIALAAVAERLGAPAAYGTAAALLLVTAVVAASMSERDRGVASPAGM